MADRRPRGGMPGGGGMLPADTTVRHYNRLVDWKKTTGNPDRVGGIVGSGYVPGDSFSFIDLASKIKLAWMFSYHHEGTSRLRSFIGNYQVLSHNVSRKARLDQMAAQLGKRRNNKEISAQTYGQRIMYEAERYYGWLYSKRAITEAQYKENMKDFAEKHGIEYVFEDEEPTKSR